MLVWWFALFLRVHLWVIDCVFDVWVIVWCWVRFVVWGVLVWLYLIDLAVSLRGVFYG